MKRLFLVCILLVAAVASAEWVQYVPEQGVVLAHYASHREGAATRGRTLEGDLWYALEAPSGTAFAELTPAEVSNLVTEADAAYQAAKSDLHKAADNALIAVLIRAELVPEGTTALPRGTYDAVAEYLLVQEVADPTNVTIQALSSKLNRLRGIIEKEGGDPDDAALHQ